MLYRVIWSYQHYHEQRYEQNFGLALARHESVSTNPGTILANEFFLLPRYPPDRRTGALTERRD